MASNNALLRGTAAGEGLLVTGIECSGEGVVASNLCVIREVLVCLSITGGVMAIS